jgi:hypothetical protein
MNPGKGIGMPYVNMGDLDKVGASWFYDWSSSHHIDPRYVPMSWGGSDPNLPLSYSGYVLLFNEPDRAEQANISPADGLALYKIFYWKYPQVKWVVGNVFYAPWLYQFQALCTAEPDIPMPAAWGLHVYVNGADHMERMLDYLEDAHNLLGGDFWITEFADVFGDVYVDNGLVHYFQTHDWIKRWAYFCNRAHGDEWWFPQSWHDFQLFDWVNGEFTEAGRWYKSTGKEHKIYLPIMRKD